MKINHVKIVLNYFLVLICLSLESLFQVGLNMRPASLFNWFDCRYLQTVSVYCVVNC